MQQAKRRILFQVTTRVDGHKFVIYTNGDVEGFGDGVTVCNYHPTLLKQALCQFSAENGIPRRVTSPTSRSTSEDRGAGHSTPA